ncbi:MAG: signal peptidase I [Promethearchaeota archaeon]
MDSEKRKTLASIIIVGAIIGGMVGSFFILKAAMNTPIPVVVVSSGSMEPTINEGDILFIKNVSAKDIQSGDHDARTGDVIVYETKGVWNHPISEPVVHRVINKSYHDGKYWFICQGDANPVADPGYYPPVEIPEDKVYGKVVGVIPKIGWVKLFLDRSGLTMVLLVTVGILLVLSILWDMIKPGEGKEDNEMPRESNIKEDKT